jgi:HSP20 family protein
MSLVKFNKRPLTHFMPSNFMPSNFLDLDDFLENRFWSAEILSNNFWNGKTQEPALNIKEKEDQFEIELAAPGFSKKDFEVNVDNGCLNISAEKSSSKSEKEDDYTRKEFSYNSFQRSLELPENVKEEEIKASYKDGILSFSLAKKEEVKKDKPKKIEIL